MEILDSNKVLKYRMVTSLVPFSCYACGRLIVDGYKVYFPNTMEAHILCSECLKKLENDYSEVLCI